MSNSNGEVSTSVILPHGVILAGGKASRFNGVDKGRLQLGSATLFDHVLERFAPQVSSVALNANGDAARFSDLTMPVVADAIELHAGPLAGVLAGLDWGASEGADYVVTVPSDTPFLPPDLVARLTAASKARGGGIAIAATEEDGVLMRHPTCAVWPTALREDLKGALQGGLRKMTDWADRHDPAHAVFSSDKVEPFFNINSPEDLARAEEYL